MAAISLFGQRLCMSQPSTRIHQQLFVRTRRSFKSLSIKRISYSKKDLIKDHRLVNILPFQVLSRVSYHGAHASSNGLEPQKEVGTLSLVKSMWPYIWPKGRRDIKMRVFQSLGLLFAGKGVNCYVPFLFKDAVNFLNDSSNWLNLSDPSSTLLTGATVCLMAYGISRTTASFFNESKNAVFSKVSHNSIRTVAQEVFLHLHGLDLSYHLSRQTGALAKDIDRGLKGISSLISSIVLNLFPTIIEVTIVMAILSWKCGTIYSLVGLGTITAYSAFTILTTQWRTKFRRQMNQADRDAGNQAIDSLINYETVKYFNNEMYEAQKYDKYLERYQKASLKTASSLSMLNFGQNFIFTVGLTAMMILASQSIMAGTLTVGDMVMINALLFQVSLPLSFLGSVYRDTMQAKTDTSSMFDLLKREPKVATLPNAAGLKVTKKDASISFNNVTFGYLPDKNILDGLSFTVPAGKTVAIVGGSGSGKSTLARLMFRFFDPDSGSVSINNQDIKSVTLESLRQSIGIVPQDCVLFHDTIFNNIHYGDMSKSADDVFHAAKIARLHDNIVYDFPKQYDTEVGERGLKLSGGEKQRVAIARVIMKDAPIFIYDEATSSLDSITERSIMEALTSITSGRTTIMIAHRLSTVKDADFILVLKNGKVMEKGTHRQLLSNPGSYYRELWETQTSIPIEEVVQDKAEDLKD